MPPIFLRWKASRAGRFFCVHLSSAPAGMRAAPMLLTILASMSSFFILARFHDHCVPVVMVSVNCLDNDMSAISTDFESAG